MTRCDLVLHVGMPGAAADGARDLLERRRDRLRAAGIAYLGQDALLGLSHVRGWMRDDDQDPAMAERFAGELAGLARAERDAAGGADAVVLVSSDHLLGRGSIGRVDTATFRPWAERALAQVIAALDTTRARIVLHPRRQDLLMEDAYLDELERGGRHRFATQFPAPVLDYGPLVDRIRGFDRVTDIRIRPFENFAGAADLAADLVAATGIACSLRPNGPGRPGPRRYSARAVALALVMNPHLQNAAERERLTEFLLDTFGVGADEAAQRGLLRPRTRRRILAGYADANRRLFREHCPDLPADSYRDDASTQRLEPPAPHVNAAYRSWDALRRWRPRLPASSRLPDVEDEE